MFVRQFSRALSTVGSISVRNCLNTQKQFAGFPSSLCRSFSDVTLAETSLEAAPSFHAPYTKVLNPGDHTEEHIGLWYTVPEEEYNTLFRNHYTLPVNLLEILPAIRETSFMIRRPSVSVISYIKQLNLDAIIPPKFLFYGNVGCGKTLSIAHVVHFLHKSDFVIIQAPFLHRWLCQPYKKKFRDELLPSLTVPNRWDHGRDAAAWLKIFKTQNLERLQNPELVLGEEYKFSSRESCSKGDTVLSVVDMGLNRPRLASDCALTVAKEMKRLATEGKTKIAVVMDGINAAFTSTSVFKKDITTFDPRKRFMMAKDMTLCHAFLQFFENDWKNGVILGSVDTLCRPLTDREIITPRYLLEEEGFETLDPYVAVPVPEYSEKEFESAYNYFASKRFIQRPAALTENGKAFIKVETGKNPLKLLYTVSSL